MTASTSERQTLRTTSEDHIVAALAALAVAIHVVEAALPTPLPGIKPGLANVIVVAALVHFGWRTAAWVSLLRVLAGSLLVGSFLTPGFLLSLAGAIASLTALALGNALPRRPLSALGLSVLAALAHMGGQYLVARWFLIPHPALANLLPLLMTAALVFGIVSGTIASAMLRRTDLRPA